MKKRSVKSRRRKPAGKKKTTGRSRRHESGGKRTATFRKLSTSVEALLKWTQEVDGLSGRIHQEMSNIREATGQADAIAFIQKLQCDRPILEEFYLWAQEAEKTSSNEDVTANKEKLEEGQSLVSSLFELLDQHYSVGPIEGPNAIIDTPKPSDKKYKFSERYNPGFRKSRVLFPGLRVGNRTISPCEIEQIQE